MAKRKNARTSADTSKATPPSTYTMSLAAILDGSARTMFSTETRWATAILLFLRAAEDRNDNAAHDSAPSLNELVNFAKQLGTSAMIKRADFDAVVLEAFAQNSIDDEAGQALLNAIPDNALKRAAEIFDIEADGLNPANRKVRIDNALRLIRSCPPDSNSPGLINMPRTIAGFMAAICLPESLTKTLSVAAPVCENGDALLGALDACNLRSEPCTASLEGTSFNLVETALCELTINSAGYDNTTSVIHNDDVSLSYVPLGLKHAAFDIVLASHSAFLHRRRAYEKTQPEQSIETWTPYIDNVDGKLTDPFPDDTDQILAPEITLMHYCANLLSEEGRAALWVPATFSRNAWVEDLGTRLLEENLLHTIVELNTMNDAQEGPLMPMSIWVLSRNRSEDEPVLLVSLDDEGFNDYCDGTAESFFTFVDKALSDNPAALKAVELVRQREAVDRCAVLIDRDTILASEPFSLRFSDYASSVDVASKLASGKSWDELVSNYEANMQSLRDGEDDFMAALERFHKLVD